MSKPVDYDIDLCQGADFIIKIAIKDDAGALLDLTGYSFSSDIRKTISDTTTIETFDFNILDQVTNTGEVEMTLPAARSSAILLKSQKSNLRETEDFAYDVEMTDAGSDVKRLMQGLVKISPEVTR